MNRRTLAPRHTLAPGGFAGFLACGIGGVRVAFDNPENLGAQIMERLGANHTETKGLLDKADTRLGAVEARLLDLEQKSVRRGGGPAPEPEAKSLGERFVQGNAFKGYISDGMKGTVRVEVKAITSASGSAGGAQGGFVAPDRQAEVIALPQQVMTIRSLIAPGRTASNAVHFIRQTLRQNAAAPVAEAPSAPKPQSDYAWEELVAPVKTNAH